MSEASMVERVARAIGKSAGRSDMTAVTMGTRLAARAAIEAMRELDGEVMVAWMKAYLEAIDARTPDRIKGVPARDLTPQEERVRLMYLGSTLLHGPTISAAHRAAIDAALSDA